MQKIKIPIIPLPKGRPRFTKNGHAYTPKKTRDYEETLRQHIRMVWKGPRIERQPVLLFLDLILPIPKSWPEWKKIEALEGNRYPTSKPDLDNLEKAVMDAMDGVVFKDDAQVVGKYSNKYYGDEPSVNVYVNVNKDAYTHNRLKDKPASI